MRSFPVYFFAVLLMVTGCRKNKRIAFTLNSLTLKAVKMEGLPKQNLFMKVLKNEGTAPETLAVTGKYPSEYTLPVKFGLEHSVQMNFHQNSYSVALYGDSSGYLGSNPVNPDDYKILYPLDMDTEKNGIGIILSGTWR